MNTRSNKKLCSLEVTKKNIPFIV